jgi:hypothetical protein
MKRLALVAALAAATLALPAQAVGYTADLRIHDRTAGRELPVHWHEGRAYVVGRPGNEYQLTIRNAAGEDLLAVVSVDGVNVVSGQTADTGQGGYVLSRRETLGIKGWRKSLEQTAAFYFTSLPDSYAARTGRPGNVGVIGVALFRRKAEEPKLLAPSPEAPAASAPWREGESASDNAGPMQKGAERAAASPLGTGHGRREESHARHVSFERATPTPAETITIHYDSHRNLVARGILPGSIAPRDPHPFPGGFVRDP